MTEAILVGDLGTGSLRVAALGIMGDALAEERLSLEVDEPSLGWAEADPQTWWDALARATGKVLERLPRSVAIRGICLTGVTRSQIFLDRAGGVLRPAILFRDRRAIEDARLLEAHFPTANPADRISAFHPLARVAWVRHHEPDVFRRASAVVEPKDYLNFKLTGTIATDAVAQSRFEAIARAPGSRADWIEHLLSLVLVPAYMPWHPIGQVATSEAPFDRLRGLPVFVGAMDTWAAAVGAGCVLPGQAYDVSGTSEAVGLVTRSPAQVCGLVSLVWGEGVRQVGGPTQVGADSLAWAHETFRAAGDLSEAAERAGALTPSEGLPLFLPYLAGERAPIWQSDVRGAFVGLERGVGADGMLWSVLEGVAHSVRDIAEAAARGVDEKLRELRICGGGARSEAWCQLRADVLGVPVARTQALETGLVGAAMAGALGLGAYASLPDAVKAMCRVERVFCPREDFRGLFERRARNYQSIKAFALALAEAPDSSAATCSVQDSVRP